MAPHISLVLILYVCWSATVAALPLEPYGSTKIKNCLFTGKFEVNLRFELPLTISLASLPSSQPKADQTTPPSTLTSTLPTTTVTTTQPTTTVTTTQPTTTVTTTQPTTTVTTTAPTTTPQPRGCGQYPVQAFMMGTSSATQCQPWLGYAAYKKSYMNNAILIEDDTVLSIQQVYIERFQPEYYFGKKYNTKITGDGSKAANVTRVIQGGNNFILTKLTEKVNITGCVNPICIPQSKDDYTMENCFAASYVKADDDTMHVEIGKTRLIKSPCLSSGQPLLTLCAYNFVQICNRDKENGGALICQSKKDKSWMLAGLTRETSDTAGCVPNAWNEPVFYWDTVEIMKFFKPSANP